MIMAKRRDKEAKLFSEGEYALIRDLKQRRANYYLTKQMWKGAPSQTINQPLVTPEKSDWELIEGVANQIIPSLINDYDGGEA